MQHFFLHITGGPNIEMGRRANLKGRYRLLNEASLLERAKRTFDPRHRFYQAILSNETYETYLAAVGDNRGPFSGRGEGPFIHCSSPAFETVRRVHAGRGSAAKRRLW